MEGTSAASTIDIRSAFELPSGIYLYSHAVGCLPKVSREGASAYFEQWATLGGNAWDPWLGEVARFNTALAKLLNANAADVCPQVNLSAALSKIIQALPKRAGRDRIVLSLLDFPTIGFVAQQAKKMGYRVDFADASLNGTDPRLASIDEDVALVLWTHAYPNTGTALEPPTREQLHGAYLCVDIAQSAGVIPIDLGARKSDPIARPGELGSPQRTTERSEGVGGWEPPQLSQSSASSWNVDFIIGSCVKWLCGGAGAGYLWVRPDLTPELEPLDVGWFSHARPFEFDITLFEYAPNAARFWGGTPSVLPYAVAARSIGLIDSIGVHNIRAHNLTLSRIVTDVATKKGIKVVSPIGDTQSGTVVLDFGDNWEAKQRLNAAGVHCDSRKYGVRISPHIYNTVEEMHQLSELL